jgi:hypothetical protein
VKNMTLFAEEVIPRIRARGTNPMLRQAGAAEVGA